MSRVIRAVAVVVSLFIVISADGAGAASPVGSTSVDPRTGVATWTKAVECTPGDDVEIDVTITQRGAVAFTEAFFECPAAGTVVVARDTRIEEGSALLHPGPAHVSIQRVDYLASSDYQDSVRHSASADVRLLAVPH